MSQRKKITKEIRKRLEGNENVKKQHMKLYGVRLT